MPEDKTVQEFHDRAKQAGDQLRAYIVSISVAATGMLFVNLTDSAHALSEGQKVIVAVAVLMFTATVGLSLTELHLNARRFYEITKQKGREKPDWSQNERLKAARLRIIWCSYASMAVGLLATLVYMLMRI